MTDSREAARQQATDWFARRDEVAGNPVLRHQFEQWRNASNAHAQAYQALETMWNDLAFEQALRNLETGLDIPERPPAKRRRSRLFAVAASLLIMLTGGWIADVPMRLRADHMTSVAEVQRLTLEDGSQILLGSHSAISTHMQGPQRQIRLLRGEVFIEAFHDASRPMIVESAGAKVTVVGTQFSVALNDQDVTVAVREGRVNVADTRGKQNLLLAGSWQQLRQDHLQAAHTEGAERQMAWVNGRLSFQDAPLAEVLDTLKRYYPAPIWLLDAEAAKVRVSGNYRLDDPLAIVQALSKVAATHVTQLPGKVLVIH